jgi:hypothetical protein
MKAALLGGSALLAAAVPLSAQIVNPQWNLPNSSSTPPDASTGSDTTAQTGSTNTPGSTTGWYMSPAPNPASNYTNPGQRDQFYSNEPISGQNGWSFWLQCFTYQGYASQPVTATDSSQPITPGTTYLFSSLFSFQDGTGPGEGFNGTTLVNQTSPLSPNTGNLYSYLGILWENSGVPIGSVDSDGVSTETTIPAGSVTQYAIATGTGAGSSPWIPYYLTATAPAGANEAVLYVGWNNGGTDGNTGSQSAFADDEHFAVVPEPASLGLLSIGAVGLLVRRRNAAKA